MATRRIVPRRPPAAVRDEGRAGSTVRAVLGAGLLALMIVVPVAAQDAGAADPGATSEDGSRRDSVLSGIRIGDPVRIDANGFDELVGRYVGRRNGSFLVRTGRSREEEVRVPVEALERLWTAETDVGEEALLGALVGGGLGALASVVYVSGLCQVECGDDYGVAVPLATVTGGLVGAGAGAIAGSLSTRWELAFPP